MKPTRSLLRLAEILWCWAAGPKLGSGGSLHTPEDLDLRPACNQLTAPSMSGVSRQNLQGKAHGCQAESHSPVWKLAAATRRAGAGTAAAALAKHWGVPCIDLTQQTGKGHLPVDSSSRAGIGECPGRVLSAVRWNRGCCRGSRIPGIQKVPRSWILGKRESGEPRKSIFRYVSVVGVVSIASRPFHHPCVGTDR